ncbi:MAG: 50S ribosomal protein L15 [Candidatus Andersenbacteria bacterium CG10_big_fil_rev_8_21_14_0_10_54_11]|uniref:Large ribosomal subunit protein uL15 n=1 Tax=Candidatus Andersenbacteria bacterium CG10_big_fil_rev_8_21_14_0_10_54_11 TaxID=1974485 RepID=A0A2M6WYS9_9BACT|nr:MAG: 50S ribosomal protein L15 [Candidatus Andersenbacteria bacterium CG10_big_fil_rev_8_21_14_0_10_54_11]
MSRVMLHTLPSLVRRKKRVGRGVGSRGAKSGRGMKGQRSRAGYSKKAGFEGGQTPLYMRLPKGRGTKQVFSPQGGLTTTVTIRQLAGIPGAVIGYTALRRAGLVPRGSSRIKLIGNGTMKRKVAVRVHAATPAAAAAVAAAGGSVELIQQVTDQK